MSGGAVLFTAIIFYLLSGAVRVSGLEATEGQNVSIAFEFDEEVTAGKVRIIQTTTGHEKILIAKCCFQNERCKPLNRPGDLLQIVGNMLFLFVHNVNCSRDSGFYEAEVYNGKQVAKKNITLFVHPRFLSTPPPQAQTQKPPNSERQRKFVLIPLLVFLLAVSLMLGCRFFRNHQRGQHPPIINVSAEV